MVLTRTVVLFIAKFAGRRKPAYAIACYGIKGLTGAIALAMIVKSFAGIFK